MNGNALGSISFAIACEFKKVREVACPSVSKQGNFINIHTQFCHRLICIFELLNNKVNLSFSYRIVVFVFVLALGFLLANIAQIIIPLIAGISWESLSQDGISALSEGGKPLMRATIFASQLFSILIPAVFYMWYTQRNNAVVHFDLDKLPTALLIVLGIAFLFVGMPLVSYSYQLNMMITLPEWMVSMEETTAEIMSDLISMDHFFDFLINIFLIAVLAGVGEELLFRGVIQKGLLKWIQNPPIAILLASILFSAFHLQFEGFLPRMVLGMILGYAYFITKNLWLPIFIHFINNATPLISLYLFGDDLNTLDPENAPQVSWWVALLSLAGLFVVAKILTVISKRNEP
jgi:membrane protease YdiL (CAAX protease family)